MRVKRNKTKQPIKGQMARRLVYYCIFVLSITAIWAAIVKTMGVYLDRTVDLTDVLVFIGGAFGGELLMLLCKRIFAKDKDNTEQEDVDE